ncbi:phenylalanine--tRNA ligase subunit beta [Candidatus Gracilibacteria bacterium]|nr:phenylalanine--tRNA ligase subunit beta [Candidatus Gracilibacteria bacterium]MCF7856029.1 phenylalanine--tRNA ligase subunit beta [Candidatus Gracilibacteria bacterium]MCF7896416.1 phenylalanine--tRNA ligase subunit beta [Candidatus Gracilibacteria bacterium]
MILSLDWLSDFVDLSQISAENLAALLTERVAEVEKIQSSGCAIPLVVVGQILKIEPIIGADKIQLTTVDVGTEKLQIICGAKNIHEDAKVPVALVGCVLPGDFKIEKRKMKGVESNGMICSESELGLKEKSEGILLLDDSAQIGQKFSEFFGGSTVFEIDNHAITHRSDLFSQLGFGREVAVLLDQKFENRPVALPVISAKIDVEVAEPKLCSRYTALKISGIKVQPSSQKIRERLESCGVRSINNVVDATNYVLLELGQPLHSFDAKKIAGGWLIVRKAKSGEELKALDGTTLELSPENLVIADAEKPVALAGVMGGANSEVDDATTEIILESANFDAVSIRRTSLEFALRSESSLRFEKRLDPNLPPQALARFVEVLRETFPELKITAAADVQNFTAEKRIIDFALKNLNQKLGQKVPAEKAAKILTELGFKVQKNSPENWKVEVPSFRAGRDVEREIDLIEEVVRHLGYSDLPAEFPSIRMTPPRFSSANELKKEIEDALVGFGFHETATLAMVSTDLLNCANQKSETAMRLQNPPSEDYRFLRNSLLASLLEVAAHNVKNENAFRLFEISTIFEDGVEKNRLVALLIGESNAFLKIRGVLEKLLASLQFSFELNEAVEIPTTAHPGRVVGIKIAGKNIGTVAELHPAVVKNFGLPQSAFLEIDFDTLSQISRSVAKVKDLPKFPGVPRDLAILVDCKKTVREVENAILTADSKIQDLKLFDIYVGDKIPTDSKSLAFSFMIRDSEKTLEEVEAEEILQKIVANLTQIGGKLRS